MNNENKILSLILSLMILINYSQCTFDDKISDADPEPWPALISTNSAPAYSTHPSPRDRVRNRIPRGMENTSKSLVDLPEGPLDLIFEKLRGQNRLTDIKSLMLTSRNLKQIGSNHLAWLTEMRNYCSDAAFVEGLRKGRLLITSDGNCVDRFRRVAMSTKHGPTIQAHIYGFVFVFSDERSIDNILMMIDLVDKLKDDVEIVAFVFDDALETSKENISRIVSKFEGIKFTNLKRFQARLSKNDDDLGRELVRVVLPNVVSSLNYFILYNVYATNKYIPLLRGVLELTEKSLTTLQKFLIRFNRHFNLNWSRPLLVGLQQRVCAMSKLKSLILKLPSIEYSLEMMGRSNCKLPYLNKLHLEDVEYDILHFNFNSFNLIPDQFRNWVNSLPSLKQLTLIGFYETSALISQTRLQEFQGQISRGSLGRSLDKLVALQKKHADVSFSVIGFSGINIFSRQKLILETSNVLEIMLQQRLVYMVPVMDFTGKIGTLGRAVSWIKSHSNSHVLKRLTLRFSESDLMFDLGGEDKIRSYAANISALLNMLAILKSYDSSFHIQVMFNDLTISDAFALKLGKFIKDFSGSSSVVIRARFANVNAFIRLRSLIGHKSIRIIELQ